MAENPVEKWLESNEYAEISSIQLKPIKHQLIPEKPLSVQKGQAEAFFFEDDNNQWWVLKKFHKGCNLPLEYLNKVKDILPAEENFKCGNQRLILSSSDLDQNNYHCSDLAAWLEGTILMPRIEAYDWGAVADDLRDGEIVLDRHQRLKLCYNLASCIELLEKHDCSHCDLSCGNIMIDTNTLSMHLIDFDSIYHPDLSTPGITITGTQGYISHFIWMNDAIEENATWQKHVDRYSMGLLIIEFLLIKPGINSTNEGGIFDQNEIKQKSGQGLSNILNSLDNEYPRAADLLRRMLNSNNFADCPTPSEWKKFAELGNIKAPEINNLPAFSDDHFVKILQKCRKSQKAWPAPSIGQLPEVKVTLPTIPESTEEACSVEIPENPWIAC